jgi:LuxR family maltose regulon positive regulatory protein
MHVGIAGVLLERGDLAGAAEQLTASERLGEYNGLPQNPYRWRVVAARLRRAEGDLDAALELLEEADRLYNGDYSPNVQPVPAVRARLRLHRGELAYAEDWARERGLAADDDVTYLQEYEHITYAQVLLARPGGDAIDPAMALLARLLVAAELGERGGSVLEILLLQALGQKARGHAAKAEAVLHRAVSLAEPEGYVRIFADHGARLESLLTSLARQQSGSVYLRGLVTGVASGPAPTSGPTSGLVEPLSERELDVLRLLASELDGPDIARALHISLNTMRTHSRNIFRKLQVNNRRAAVRRATELGLLSKTR